MNNFSVRYDKDRFNQEQNAVIGDALAFAVAAHSGQLRASGEPYVTHPIAVAEIVADWGLDYEALAAALLHDVVEDTGATPQVLNGRFGQEVAGLVDGVTKLRLSTAPRLPEDSIRRAASTENLRKLLLATARDQRVILIKLADRLHNLRTLTHLPPDRRMRIARESLEVYAPLADRLGMGQLKVELDDLGFRYAKPDEFAALERQVKVRAEKAKRYLAVLKRAIREYLVAGGVEIIDISARPKHFYSIYKKLAKVDGDIEKIYDLMAVRVIVPDVSACYQTLGLLHQHYRPLIYRIKDYIAVPKPNGYQSLHTTVFAEDGHITEIQIRTPEMHMAAEYGVAAHFYYSEQKMGGGNLMGEAVPENLAWVQRLQGLQQAAMSEQEFVEGAKLDLFTDRIFVFSPKGDLYDLPEGATPLDFAFGVHGDIGLRALGAKVNGKLVPLDSRLENRDVVEILTRREPAPSRDWLNLVVTSQAKSKIKAWFRAASREANVASGRTILETELRAWGVRRLEELPKRYVADALDNLHIKNEEDLLAQIGEGALATAPVIRRLIPDAARPKGAVTVRRKEPTGRIMVAGEDLPYTLAPCCRPVFPQPLIGFVTRGKGVTVHALGCRNLPSDPERYAECHWETAAEPAEFVVCRIEIEALNRKGLVADVAGVVVKRQLALRDMTTVRDATDETHTRLSFAIEVPDLFMLARVMHDFERLSGVISVRRPDLAA